MILAAILLMARMGWSAAAAEPAATLYQRHCAVCHGRNGDGNGGHLSQKAMPAHSFRDCSWMNLMSDATLFLAIHDGGAAVGMNSAMPGFGGRVTNDEIAALVRLVRGFCAAPIPMAAPTPGSPASH